MAPKETQQVPDGVRPEVRRFAIAQECILRSHDEKGGWRRDSPFDLFRKLNTEVKELYYAIGHESPERIREEAVDVANFAMMIFDLTMSEAKEKDA